MDASVRSEVEVARAEAKANYDKVRESKTRTTGELYSAMYKLELYDALLEGRMYEVGMLEELEMASLIKQLRDGPAGDDLRRIENEWVTDSAIKLGYQPMPPEERQRFALDNPDWNERYFWNEGRIFITWQDKYTAWQEAWQEAKTEGRDWEGGDWRKTWRGGWRGEGISLRSERTLNPLVVLVGMLVSIVILWRVGLIVYRAIDHGVISP